MLRSHNFAPLTRSRAIATVPTPLNQTPYLTLFVIGRGLLGSGLLPARVHADRAWLRLQLCALALPCLPQNAHKVAEGAERPTVPPRAQGFLEGGENHNTSETFGNLCRLHNASPTPPPPSYSRIGIATATLPYLPSLHTEGESGGSPLACPITRAHNTRTHTHTPRSKPPGCPNPCDQVDLSSSEARSTGPPEGAYPFENWSSCSWRTLANVALHAFFNKGPNKKQKSADINGAPGAAFMRRRRRRRHHLGLSAPGGGDADGTRVGRAQATTRQSRSTATRQIVKRCASLT